MRDAVRRAARKGEADAWASSYFHFFI